MSCGEGGEGGCRTRLPSYSLMKEEEEVITWREGGRERRKERGREGDRAFLVCVSL